MLEDEARRSPGKAERACAFGDGRLLPHPGLEVHIGPPEPGGESAGDPADLLVEVFVGAVVAYADEVKARELGVPREILERHGAVSAETAAAMAAGARDRLKADLAVAVTGIAGPGGGSDEKPVGLVFLHAEGPEGSRSADFVFPGNRDSIRRRAAVTALHQLRRLLEQTRDESA